jgi:hypothetical protein
MNWQRSNIQAAAAYLRERIAAGAADARTRTIYEGLLEVIDPNRRTAGLQREMAESAKAAVTAHANRERRAGRDRRGHPDRRQVNLAPPDGVERRRGNRRAGTDRRGGR